MILLDLAVTARIGKTKQKEKHGLAKTVLYFGKIGDLKLT